MQMDVTLFLQILIYILLVALIIILIILGIKAINLVGRVNKVVDGVEEKIKKTDNVFSIIDRTADMASNVSDKIISGIFNFITNIFKKKGNDENE